MRKLPILFLCLLFCCCKSQPKVSPVKLQAEELDVIKDTFPDATCCYLLEKEHPTFKYNLRESKQTTEKRYKVWPDSAYQNLTIKLVYYVNDTLFNPKEMGLSVRYYPRIKDDPALLKLEKNFLQMNIQNKL